MPCPLLPKGSFKPPAWKPSLWASQARTSHFHFSRVSNFFGFLIFFSLGFVGLIAWSFELKLCSLQLTLVLQVNGFSSNFDFFMVFIFVSFFGVNFCPFLFHITLICNLYFLQFDWNDGFNYERWIAHVHSPWVMGLWCLIHCMRNKVSIFCLCSLKFCCLYILFHYYYAS